MNECQLKCKEYESYQFKKSRVAYVSQCTFDYLISLLITDAFLAKVLAYIGLSDAQIGIISSFIYFSFLFQILSLCLVNKIKTVKKTVVIFDSLSQLLHIALYCVPFIEVNKSIKSFIAVGVIFLVYFLKYLVSSILFEWANSYVKPSRRGIFSSIKEMISLFCGMIFTLVVGVMVDEYESVGDIETAFGIIVGILIVLNVFNFISLIGIKNKKSEKKRSNIPIKIVIENVLGNKSYRNVIVLLTMINIANCITVSFMGTFKTKDLLMPVGLVQGINTLACGMRMIFSISFGKYSDKKSYAKGIELALVISAIGFMFNIFTTNTTWWCIIIYTVLYNISVAGTNANKFNITYSYIKREYIMHAITIQNCISGIVGFFATLIGSCILTFIQNNENRFLGINVYGQQVLSIISLLIVLIAIVYDRYVVEKQEMI